jgi:signal transduction histidine kinase
MKKIAIFNRKYDHMLRIRFFSILILLLGLGITFILSYSSFKDMKRLKMQESESIYDSFEQKLQIQIKANTQVLYNSAAFIQSSDTITRAEWKSFQYLNKSYSELPGIHGIGYAVVVPPEQVEKFEKKIRKVEFPDFRIFPVGKRSFYAPVLYIEPFTDLNKLALGYDGFTNPIRQKAMTLSRDSDIAVLSDKVFLFQKTDTQTVIGTIMYAPVYRTGASKRNVQERRAAIVGWVLSPFHLEDMIKSMLKDWDVQKIALKIYDEKLELPGNLLFDSDSVFQVLRQIKPNSVSTKQINLNGKIWTIKFSNYNNHINLLSVQVLRIFIGGSIISILLFILTINLIAARARNRRIQALNEELKKANANKDRFISILAHDLKSPFNSLLGFSELLSENYHEFEPHEIENYIKLIHSSANVAFNLLDELLLWTRVQTAHFPYNPEKIDLIELCKSQIEEHALISGKKNISILINPTSSIFVMADEMMLKVILRNLLMNAIKYSYEGGTIRITTLVKKNWVTVTVRDSGIGISPEELLKLFDVSQVKSKDGTANEKGTGLGLLLCKDMVSKHGGRIWAESNQGGGSQFSFTLPLA